MPEQKPKRILIAGREPSDFLCRLAAELNRTGLFAIDLFEFRDVPTHNRQDAESAFGTIHDSSVLKISGRPVAQLVKQGCLKSLVRSLACRHSPHTVIRNGLRGGNLRRLFQPYDLVHFQQLTPECLDVAWHVPQECMKAFTFWGSDLFSCNKNFDYGRQKAALQTADLITVHSAEMRLIFRSKFGRDFQGSLEALLVASGDDVFDQIDQIRKTHINEKWRTKNSIKNESIVVIVGGSALPSGRHHETVGQISQLSEEEKQAFHFVFPLTYGSPDADYIPSLKKLVAQCDLSATFLEKFLPSEEVAQMRLSADVSIKTPDYDALSLALCEDIYCGAIPIVGTWLPYGPLRAADIHLLEVESISQISHQLSRLSRDWKKHRVESLENPQKIRSLLSQTHRTEEWTDLYSRVLNVNR